jgi:hypothetical protein
MDKYSFETFGRPKQTFDNYNPEAGPRRSDLLALQYSDYVAKLLEGRSTGARVTREVSDSTLAVGGAFLAATETLEIAAETVAGIGVGAVIIRELQKIFNAGGRSEAFADAAYLIRQAQSEYRQYNPNPLPDRLTENGAILVSRVDAALHAARKTLNGRMPGLLDLKQATQPMTKAGADRESSGTPQTISTASGDTPGQAAAREAVLQARVDDALTIRRTGTTQLSPKEIDALVEERIKKKEQRDKTKALGLPSFKEFNQLITAIDAGIPGGEKANVYTDLFTKAEINLNSPEFEGLAPTFNRQTLVEAYRAFPSKQSAIFELVTELKAKFPPLQPPLPALNP